MTDPAATYDGTLETAADGGLIRFERRLPYSIDDVWSAATTPERLAQWWLPFDADVSVDLREGGRIVFAGRGEQPFTMTHTITRLDPPHLMQHTHADDGSYLRWELEAVEDGCILRLTHFLPHPEIVAEQPFVVGLHTSLSRLAPLLAGHPVPWDWDEFAAAQAAYAARSLAPRPEAS